MAKRYAMITGAAGGIGRALCRAFKERGYSVLAIDRSEAAVDCEQFIVADFCSANAGFINGACISLDGGISGTLHDPDTL